MVMRNRASNKHQTNVADWQIRNFGFATVINEDGTDGRYDRTRQHEYGRMDGREMNKGMNEQENNKRDAMD